MPQVIGIPTETFPEEKRVATVPEVAANQPTPWFGLSERISQYAHGLWPAMLAIVLLTEQRVQRAS